MASPWGVFFYPPVADPNLLPFSQLPLSAAVPQSESDSRIGEQICGFLFCPSICCFSLFLSFSQKIPQLNVLAISQKFDIFSNFFHKNNLTLLI